MGMTLTDDLTSYDESQEYYYRNQKTVYRCPFCTLDYDSQGNEVRADEAIDDIIDKACESCSFSNDMETVAKIFRRYFDGCNKTETEEMLLAYHRINAKFDGEFTVYINEIISDINP